MSDPIRFDQVSVVAKANVYFDGKVVSHTVFMPDGTKKTLGIIYPGQYHFDTGVPEIMDIVAGDCSVCMQGESEWNAYSGGSRFEVPGSSGFDINVTSGLCEYICSYK